MKIWNYNEIKIDKNVKSEDFLKTEDNSDIGHYVECDLIYPDKITKKRRVSILPWKKVSTQDVLSAYMTELKPVDYTQKTIISCLDWQKKNLIYCRMLKFFVGHGMIVDEIQKTVFLKQSLLLKNL